MSFDPDKLYLTKKQIIAIGDRLIARWKQNPTANAKMIVITKGAQFLVKRTPEKDVAQYYKEFWSEAYEVMVQNALEGNKELNLLKQVKEKQPLAPKAKLDFTKALNYGAMKE